MHASAQTANASASAKRPNADNALPPLLDLLGGAECIAVEDVDPGDVVQAVDFERAIVDGARDGRLDSDAILRADVEGNILVERAVPELTFGGAQVLPYAGDSFVKILAVSSPVFSVAPGESENDIGRTPNMSKRVIAAMILGGRFRATELSAVFDLPSTSGEAPSAEDIRVLAIASFISPVHGGAQVLDGVWAIGTVPRIATIAVEINTPGEGVQSFSDMIRAGTRGSEFVLPPRAGLFSVNEVLRSRLAVLCAVSSSEKWHRYAYPVDLAINARIADERADMFANSAIGARLATSAAVALRVGAPLTPEESALLVNETPTPPAPPQTSMTMGANSTHDVRRGALIFGIDRATGVPSIIDGRFIFSPLGEKLTIARVPFTTSDSEPVALILSTGNTEQLRYFFSNTYIDDIRAREINTARAPAPRETVASLLPAGSAVPAAFNIPRKPAGPIGPVEMTAVERSNFNGIIYRTNRTRVIQNVEGFPAFSSPGITEVQDALASAREVAEKRASELQDFISESGTALTEHVVAQALSLHTWTWRSISLVRLHGKSLLMALRERDVLDADQVPPAMPEGEYEWEEADDGKPGAEGALEPDFENLRSRNRDIRNSLLIARMLRRAVPRVVGAAFDVNASIVMCLDIASSSIGHVPAIGLIDRTSFSVLSDSNAPESSEEGVIYENERVRIVVPRLEVLHARCEALATPENILPLGSVLGAVAPSEHFGTELDNSRRIVRRRRAWKIVSASINPGAQGPARATVLISPLERGEWYTNLISLEALKSAGAFQYAIAASYEVSTSSQSIPGAAFVPDDGERPLLALLWARPYIWRLPPPFTPASAPAPRLRELADGSIALSFASRPFSDTNTSRRRALRSGTVDALENIDIVEGVTMHRGRARMRRDGRFEFANLTDSLREIFLRIDRVSEMWVRSWEPIAQTLGQSITTLRISPANGRVLQTISLVGAATEGFGGDDTLGALINFDGTIVGSLTSAYGLRVYLDGEQIVFAYPEDPPSYAQMNLRRDQAVWPNLSTYLFSVDLALAFPRPLGIVGVRRDWGEGTARGKPPNEAHLMRREREERVGAGRLARVFWPGDVTPPGTYGSLRTGEVLGLSLETMRAAGIDRDSARVFPSLLIASAREMAMRASVGDVTRVGTAFSSRRVRVGM